MAADPEHQDLTSALRSAIEAAIPGATAEVTDNGARHFALVVRSASFEGKRSLEKQRAVYAAITHLMGDDNAPVHAIDSMQTLSA
jgi:acid stress-induced BolA-like protein IbaG/YrbA